MADLLSEPGDDEAPEGSARPSRRTFLTGAAGITGVALAVGAWKPVFATSDSVIEAASINGGNVRVGKIGLTLSGSSAGFVSSAEGGSAFGDVVNEKVGPDPFVRKHLGGVKYEDITLKVGTSMSKAFYSWITSSVAGRAPKLSGAIVGADANFKIFTEMNFFNALISEVGFPALDAASKDSAKMTVKFSPEFTRTAAKTGGSLPGGQVKSFKWLASNFKFTLGGVDTSHVSKIDTLAIKMNFSSDSERGGSVLQEIDIPNFKLTLPESQAQDFIAWHEDFVIKGNNSSENEKKGSLTFLSSDLKTELFRLDLAGVGIFALDHDPLVTGATGIRHVNAQLYVDQMSFSAGGSTSTD
jgi:hypothetical protein